MNNSSHVTIGTAVEIFHLEEGSVMSGYPNSSSRLSRGDYDPMEVDALLIKGAAVSALILSADVLGLERHDLQIVKQRIEEQTGVPRDNIFICCTHTHSSGSTILLGKENKRDERFLGQLLEKLVQAADRASSNLVSTVVKVVSGEADLGHNRRVVEGGKAVNVWNDADRKHTGPVDKEVGIVTFVADDNRIRAMILNVNCHPVSLGPSSACASADFPGYARSELRQSLGDMAIVYTTGAAGDINPYDGLRAEPSMSREMGEILARAVESALPEAKQIACPDLVCRHRESAFIQKKSNREVQTEFQLLAIGDDLAFLTLPGEPLVEIGLELKKLSGYQSTFVLGYTNDYLSYLVTRKAVREGGYEAIQSFNDEIEDAILSLGREWLDRQ